MKFEKPFDKYAAKIDPDELDDSFTEVYVLLDYLQDKYHVNFEYDVDNNYFIVNEEVGGNLWLDPGAHLDEQDVDDINDLLKKSSFTRVSLFSRVEGDLTQYYMEIDE